MDYIRYSNDLDRLAENANLRSFPADTGAGLVDLTSNDYLGIAQRHELTHEFYSRYAGGNLPPLTSSASRLLASCQQEFLALENYLGGLYHRHALLFNSGYHANVGIIQAIADSRTMIIADRLVHASIIDGIRLSGARFTRFAHNDLDRLERLVAETEDNVETILVIVESVYSMDGDRSDINRLIDIRNRYPRVMLYVDEAHGFGVEGPQGLGLASASKSPDDIDVIIGTFGKAVASSGAFAITNDIMKRYLINHARSLIFSTAIPPVNIAWSKFIIGKMLLMDAERDRLRRHAEKLSEAISHVTGKDGIASHIQPLVVGNAAATLNLSAKLRKEGIKVLPIRTPTVPPGTERLRFSLSAALSDSDIDKTVSAIRGLK